MDTKAGPENARIYFDLFAIDGNGFHGEIHADCVAVPFLVVAGLEALHHARFARATVADQHDFEQIVECVVGRTRAQRIHISQ